MIFFIGVLALLLEKEKYAHNFWGNFKFGNNGVDNSLKQSCPLCKFKERVFVELWDHGDKKKVNCPQCRKYTISVHDIISSAPISKAILLQIMAENSSSGQWDKFNFDIGVLSFDKINSFAKHLKEDGFIRILEDSTSFSYQITSDGWDYMKAKFF